MGRFVRISSERSINVTAGLQAVDVTDKQSANPNRLNVRQTWSNMTILIKRGVGYYPSQIKNWNTVKVLEEKNILTIGSECDTCENQAEVEEMCRKLENEEKKYENLKKQFEPATKTTKKAE